MPRFTFGGTNWDVSTTVTDAEATNPPLLWDNTSQPYPVYTDRSATAQVTEFFLWSGSSYSNEVASISTNADSFLPDFQVELPERAPLYNAKGYALLPREGAPAGDTLPEGLPGQFIGYDETGEPAALDAPDGGTSLTNGTAGRAVLAAETQELARSAMGAAAADTAVTTNTAQTITGRKDFVDIGIPAASQPSNIIDNFQGEVTAVADDVGYTKHILYTAAEGLPANPGGGFYVAYLVDTVAPTSRVATALAGDGSGTDATSYAITLTRAFAANSVALVLVGIGRTDGTASAATALSGGGMTWTRRETGVITLGNNAYALFSGVPSGTPTGTTLTTTNPLAHNAVWRVVEISNASTVVRSAVSNSMANGSPDVTLTGVSSANAVVGFCGENTNDPMNVGVGYTEVGTLVSAPGTPPAMSIKTEWRPDGQDHVGFLNATSAQKIVMAAEVS